MKNKLKVLKLNNVLIILLVLVSILFVGCENTIQTNEIVENENSSNNNDNINNFNKVNEDPNMPQNQSQNLSNNMKQPINDSSFAPENMPNEMPRDNLMGSQNEDMMLEMLEQILPNTYQSYVEGDISKEEALNTLNEYLNSLSDEERQALMPTPTNMSDRDEPMGNPEEMPQR